MCARLLACPLCSQPGFLTLDALRAGLVSVATRPLMCPVCNEVLVGIDKLTIHLFGHTININDNSIQLSKPININVDNNEISNPNVQVKSIIHNWNVLRKEPVDTGQGFIKKNKSKNCCDIDHTMQSCCTISNSINKTSTMNSLTKVQTDESFNKGSQILHISEQIYPNTSTNECFYSKENDRLFIETHDDSSTVISELSKRNCLEDCYKGNNVQEENLQRRETNKLEDVWIENLSQQVCNQHSTTKRDSLGGTNETRDIVLKQTEINNDDYNLKNNLIINFPNVMTMNDNVNVLPLEINNKEHSNDHKNTLIDSIIDVKSDQNVNGEKIISNVKLLKEKTERCNICGFHFTDSNILLLHKQLVHMVDEQNLNPTNDSLLKSYSCHLCSKVFKMRGSLMIHMRVAHIGHNWGFSSKDGDTSVGINNNGYNCPTCGKNFKKEQHVIQHLKTHEGKQWECDVCSKMFTTKYFLKKHKRLHSGEMPYKCNICDKTFTFQQSYHKHRLYHKDDKPHMCSTCGRSFKELSTLHNHERIHTGEKPFACETCGKCFRQRVSYLVHRRIHTGVMPYTCTMCGKSFRYKVSQRTHKCPIQPSNSQSQSNEIVPTLTQEICNESNQLQETNSPQQIKQILNGINDKDNKFVLIINAQGQTVLTRESDLQSEQEANFIKLKEANKNSSEDAWNSENSKNLDSESSTNNTDKLLSNNRNNVQEPTDFFSLVMSPLENDLSSPTSGMEHLRLSSPISKDVSQSLFSNFRHLSDTINENIIQAAVEETYTTDNNIRCSFETINEESLKQLLYSIAMKLYSVSDGPPSLACRQALKALNIKYELVDVDFGKGEHMTEEYEKLNPQKEIPVLVDDDLVMGESNAILQYLGDKYDTFGELYPKDPRGRAIVNHRLCFNLAYYYRNISEYVMAPIFFDYERTPLGLKKVKMALDIFNKYLQNENTTYAAANCLTIADFPLITSTMCLEAISFKLDQWPCVEKWYNNFKQSYPDLWTIAEGGMKEISYFEKNPPDLTNMDHPIHPIRKNIK